MRVPSTGKECPYFYGDYYRGKQHEECRLIGNGTPAWEMKYCRTCPVPDIVMANNCPNMILAGEIKGNLLGFNKRVAVTAYCTKSHQEVRNPYVGCGQCHPIIDLFKET